MWKRLFLISALGAIAMQAQSISLGVKLGAKLTDTIDSSGGASQQGTRFTVGPVVEVKLPFALAFEADALYRRTGYDQVLVISTPQPSTVIVRSAYTINQHADSFEFPLLAKYYFGPKLIPAKLYVSGGYALCYSFHIDEPFLIRDNPVNGVVAGVGARIHIGRFGIAPEVRYTHWTGRTFDQEGPYGLNNRSVQNQADFLLGFTF